MTKGTSRTPGLREIKRILDLLKDEDIEEIEWVRGDLKIRIKKKGASPSHGWVPPPPPIAHAAISSADPTLAAQAPPGEQEGLENLVTIRSPMVGTFYRSPLPGGEPFVKEGDQVQKGKVLCIIEAMKLMNEIESDVGGRIRSIVVEDGQAVEYGQPLFQIEPL